MLKIFLNQYSLKVINFVVRKIKNFFCCSVVDKNINLFCFNFYKENISKYTNNE